MPPFTYLDHTADTGITVTSATLPELFKDAAEGLASLLCDPANVIEMQTRSIEVSAPDVENLMVDWLSEINYRFEVDRFAFRRFAVEEVNETHVRGTAYGEPLVPGQHRVREQVKAVTYHRLKVAQEDSHWTAQVIFDV